MAEDKEKELHWVVRVMFDKETGAQFQKDVADTFGNFRKQLGEVLTNSSIDIGKGFTASLKALVGDFSKAGTDAMSGLKDAFNKALGGAAAAGGGGKAAGGEGGAAAERKRQPIEDFLDPIKELRAALGVMKDETRNAVGIVRTAMAEGWGSLSQEVPRVWATITGEMSKLGGQVGDWFDSTALGKKVQEARAWFGQLRADVQDLSGKVSDQVGKLSDSVLSRFQAGWKKIRDGAEDVADDVRDAARDAANEVGESFQEAFNGLKNSRVGQTVSGIFDGISERAGKAGDAISGKWNDALGKIQNSRVVRGVSGAFSSIESSARGAADRVYGAMSSRLQGLNPVFGRMRVAGQQAWGSMAKLFSTPIRAVGMQGFLIFLTGVQRTLQRAFKDADAWKKSLEGLDKVSMKTGQSFRFLQSVSEGVQDRFGLSARLSNQLTTAVGELAGKAGRVGETEKALDALLNVGAKKGMSTEETLQAVQNAMAGVEGGTDKLFGKSPDKLFDNFAKSINKTAQELTAEEKAQALLNATLDAGTRSQGEYNRYLETGRGAQELFQQKTEQTAATLGKALEPARQLWTSSVDWLKEKLFNFLTWGMEGIRRFIIGIQVMGADLGFAFATIPERLRLLVADSLDKIAQLVSRFSIVLKVLGVNADEVSANLHARAQQMRIEANKGINADRENRDLVYTDILIESGDVREGTAQARPQRRREEEKKTEGGTGAGNTGGGTAAGPAPSAPRTDPAEAARAAQEEELRRFAEAKDLGVLNEAELKRAQELEAQVRTQLEQSNLVIEERIRLRRQLNELAEITASEDPARKEEERLQQQEEEIALLERAAAINESRAETLARLRELESQLNAEANDNTRSLAQRVESRERLNRVTGVRQGIEQAQAQEAQAQRDAERRKKQPPVADLNIARLGKVSQEAKKILQGMEEGSKKAGDTMAGHMAGAFEKMLTGAWSVNDAMNALWQGMAKGALQGIAAKAQGRAGEEAAEAISATARGIGYAATPGMQGFAAGQFGAAAKHLLSAAAWSALAGGMGAAANAVGGGGAGAAGSSTPRESRDAGSSVAQQAEKRGPSIHVYVDGIDPSNPRHQKLTQETMKGVRERYGTDSSVTYGSRRAS